MHPDINKKEKSKQEMKADIILSGVGGQGILSIAAVIGEAALKEGLYMKQAEVHGMSQRGGRARFFGCIRRQFICRPFFPYTTLFRSDKTGSV